MQVVQTIREVRSRIGEAREKGLTTGFVPTMGYLHQGHLTLVEKARQMADLVVMSIFVNPAQFGPGEDYLTYPRDFERDCELAGEAGVDVVFSPGVEEMYPAGYATYVEVQGITDKLCGRSRPGHFKGVATVVTKLFNIVQPDMAFFGQKDFQQVLVIKKMAAELNLDVEVVTVPTVREKDGLAMSSRNVFLSPAERSAAAVLHRSLEEAQNMVAAGEKDVCRIRNRVVSMIESEPLARIDYVEIYGLPDLSQIENLAGPSLLALAVKFGRARLIDNIVLGE